MTNTMNDNVKFSHLILCKVHSVLHPDDNSRLVYIMEARNQNINLWQKNLNHCDNRAISIGAIIRYACPMPIETYMRNGIPIIQSPFPAIILKFPNRIYHLCINKEIEAHTSLGVVYNNTQVSVNFAFPIKTTCSGNLCDHQHVNDWLDKKGCGCYGMSPNSIRLVMQHAVDVQTSNGMRSMSDFSSSKFSQLYFSGDIPGSCKFYMLQLTDAAINMNSALEECVELINENGGFSVVGWYKRGIINDQSLIAARKIVNNSINQNSHNNNSSNEELQVDAGEISYHFVQIFSSNCDFLDNNAILGQRLNAMKFDITEIDAMKNMQI